MKSSYYTEVIFTQTLIQLHVCVCVTVSAKVLLKTPPTWSAPLTRPGTASRPPLRCGRRRRGRSGELLPVHRHMKPSIQLFNASDICQMIWEPCMSDLFHQSGENRSLIAALQAWCTVINVSGFPCNEAVFLLQVAFQTAWRTAWTKSSSHRPRTGPAWTRLLFIQNSMAPIGTTNHWEMLSSELNVEYRWCCKTRIHNWQCKIAFTVAFNRPFWTS